MRADRCAWAAFAATMGPLLVATEADADEIEDPLGRKPIAVHVPASYDPAEPAPLVLLLHALGTSGLWQENYMGFLPFAEEFGFLYVYPNAPTIREPACASCCDAQGQCWQWDVIDGEFDSNYLQRLIDTIMARYNVDARRVYLIGHSNGGGMAFEAACKLSDTIAAIATLAPVPLQAPCPPPSSVSALVIHGTDDDNVGYQNSPEMLADWGAHFGCLPEPEGAMPGCDPTAGRGRREGGGDDACDISLGRLDLDSGITGEESIITRYAQCALGAELELWTIPGGAHVPPLTTGFNRSVLEWLFAHPKADCNGNGVADEQDIADGRSADCDGNGFPDECDRDCNANDVPDACELSDATARDVNANGMPDECELHLFGDLDLDRDVDLADYLAFIECYSGPGELPIGEGCCRAESSGTRRGGRGGSGPCDSPADFDRDGDVDLTDLLILQSSLNLGRVVSYVCPAVTGVEHKSSDPLEFNLLPGELPATARVEVAIPELRTGFVSMTSSNPAVAGNTTIRYSSAGGVRCRAGFIEVLGPGTATLMVTNDMGFSDGPPRQINVDVPAIQCVLNTEAEDFTARVSNDGVHNWLIVPDEDRGRGYFNASGGRHLESLPGSTPPIVDGDVFANGAVVSYEFIVTQPGNHHIWVRAGAEGTGSNSFYLRVREVGAGGNIDDWWRWNPVKGLGDLADAWQGDGDLGRQTGGTVRNPQPMIETLGPGTYHLEIAMREDGSALDRIIIVEEPEIELQRKQIDNVCGPPASLPRP